jgi:hypothetical protein
MRRFLRCVPVVLGMLATGAAAQESTGIYSVARDTTFRLRAAAWFTGADGSFSVGEAIPGTIHDIDLEDTLGLDTDQTVVWATLGFNLGEHRRWHVELGYTGPFDYEGESDPVSISFNDRIFTGVIESTAELHIYEANLRYDLIQEGPFVLSIGPSVRVFDFEASVEGTATEPGSGTTAFRREDEETLLPLPGLGVGARWDITPNIFVRGNIAGVYAGGYGNFVDASAEVGWDILTNFGIFAGYRLMHAEADVEDVEFDVDLQGPYAGAELRF